MRESDSHMLVRSFLNLCLAFACVFTGASQGEGTEPLILVYDSVEKSKWEKSWGEDIVGKGIYYERLIAPPHGMMRRVALLTGRHAFFSSVYGDFPSHNRFSHEALTAERGCLVPGVMRRGNVLSGTILVVGKDFAWLKGEKLDPRREKRPVTPEDLGRTLAILSGKEQGGSNDKFTGRNIISKDKWLPLPTHNGKWGSNVVPERMRYRGALVLTDDGIWEDGLRWKGQAMDALSERELPEMLRIGGLYTDWWVSALKQLKSSRSLKVPGSAAYLDLGPNDWLPSVIKFGMPYMPENGQAWDEQLLGRALSAVTSSGIGGSWRIDIPREGNYELIFALSPIGERTGGALLFRKGEAFIRMGGGVVKMEIMEGASEVKVLIDFEAGEQSLEIHVSQQGEGEAPLSVPYGRIKYAGERKTPVLTFPGTQ